MTKKIKELTPAMKQGITRRKIEREAKRLATNKFKVIDKQNKMIDNNEAGKLDANRAKKASREQWINRNSNSTDYRLWRDKNAIRHELIILT